MTGQSKLTTADGTELPGALFEPPSGTSSGAVVLIHEWWGLNAHIRDVAQRLAREGFTVFAVDLYGGRVAAAENAAEAEALMNALDGKQALETLGRAAEALRQRGLRVGVMGFCMGGAYALAAAAHDEKLAACVPFYGIPPETRADLTKIRAPVLGHFALNDDWCTPDRVDALEKQLKEAGVQAEIHRYDAGHAFFNDTRSVYAPEHARTAWQRTVDFLRARLG